MQLIKRTGNQYVTGSGKSLGGRIEVCIRRFDRDCIVDVTKSLLHSEGLKLAVLELSPKDLEIASRVFRREDFGIRSYRLGIARDKMTIDGLLFDNHLKHVRQLC